MTVESSTALATSIDRLTASIGSDPSLIREPLAALTRTVKLAVDSYVGLELTVEDHGHVIRLTSFEDGAVATDIRSTVRLPLVALSPLVDRGSAIVFYARTPGAFVDLAADLSYALSVPVGSQGTTIRLDAVEVPDVLVSDLTGVAERSAIDRAIGVLLDHGHHPDRTHHELRRRAALAGLSAAAYAARLLSDL